MHWPMKMPKNENLPEESVVACISMIEAGRLSTSSQLVIPCPNSLTVENKKFEIQFNLVDSLPSYTAKT